MKKKAVLFILFILPIVAYLFFASGVNSFTKLPVLTSDVPDFGKWPSLRGDTLSLNGKITVLGFAGDDILTNRGNLFNLNQKVYERYHKFTDLQFVYICTPGTETDVKRIATQLGGIADMTQWHFVFAPKDEIARFYKGLNLVGGLDKHFGTPNVYLIDKERNLRGRKGDEYKEGYNTFHPSELSNFMLDDFKVMLYEYRAALKKNLPKREI